MTATADEKAQHPQAMVLAPTPVLSQTIEDTGDGPAVHFHAGGQGFWVARLMASLGVHVTLCGTFGGEVGDVVRVLIEREGVHVRDVASGIENGLSIRDERGGTSTVLIDRPPAKLARHDLDDLYGVAVVAGMEADVSVLAGSVGAHTVPPDVYRRLATDLVANGRTVVADLSGPALEASAAAGVTVLKVSAEDLIRDGRLRSDSVEDVMVAINELVAGGSFTVLVSRGPEPALARLGEETVEVVGPRLEPFQEHGAGDAMTAGLAAGLALGHTQQDALRLGAAAGALNVSRHGLGTGTRSEIERLAARVTIRPIASGGAARPTTTTPDELAARARPT